MNHDEQMAEICRSLAHTGSRRDDSAEHTLTEARRLARTLSPLADDSVVEATAQAAIAHIHGLGPLQLFMADPLVDEVMINNGGDVWVERQGHMALVGQLGLDVTPRLIERILDPIGRRLDRASPIVDARLLDGSRVCAVVQPVAVDGPCLALRRFAVRQRSLDEFATPSEVTLLTAIVEGRCNVVISGPTSSGKTSLLNVMMSLVGPAERIITLEDTAELRLDARHVLRLETRPPSVDGAREITLADLVRTALRLRPDRIVVGEVRGAEVVDMLQALNTGHDGSFSTCHANGPDDALRRLHSLVVQHTSGWPMDAVREHVRSSVDVIIHVSRGSGGARRITHIVELQPPGSPTEHRVLARHGEVLAPLGRCRS